MKCFMYDAARVHTSSEMPLEYRAYMLHLLLLEFSMKVGNPIL